MKGEWRKIHQFLRNNWKYKDNVSLTINAFGIGTDGKEEEDENEPMPKDELFIKLQRTESIFTSDILNSAASLIHDDDDDDDDAKGDEPDATIKKYKQRKLQKNPIPPIYEDDEEHDMKDPFPSYIFKGIWYKSDDEMVETLIDDCCKKVAKSFHWETVDDIKMLYDDGIYVKNEDDDDKWIYYDFVKKMYREAGRNNFFDLFISKHYKREINIWKYTMEKKLTDDTQIFQALQDMDFAKFDVNGDEGIDFYEFELGFKKLGYSVDTKKLREKFDDIDKMNKKDGTITMKEYNEWKEFEAGEDEEDDKETCYVYYNDTQEIYEFIFGEKKEETDDYQNVAKLSKRMDREKEIKWGIYINKLTKKDRKRFIKSETVNGFWKILRENDEDEEDRNKEGINSKLLKEEMLNPEQLRLIYQLLHHYYMLTMDRSLQERWSADKTPLHQLYCTHNDNNHDDNQHTKRDRLISNNIKFLIYEEEYQLTWWNEKGKYQPNAIAITNLTKYNQRKMEYDRSVLEMKEDDEKKADKQKQKKPKTAPQPIEICYMRFQCDPKAQNLRWQWYDNDNLQHQDFDHKAQDVIDELEISFLSNNKQNFDPAVFQQRFNHCLLPELEKHLSSKTHGFQNRSYMFRCTFSEDDDENPDWSNIILNIQQLTFNHDEKSKFSRNLRRMIDNRNSLEFIYRKSDEFHRKWKMKYRLYTEQQQLYFFSFIVAIVAMMKYIDIEFSNQPVVIPLYEENTEKECIIDALINPTDVTREQRVSSIFKGALIPPSNIWQLASDGNADRKPSETKILKKVTVYKRKTDEIAPKETQEIYMQHKKDYGFRHFTKKQAGFVRLAECIRKFALEYEAGDTEKCLWPWYRNSFHSNEKMCNDVDVYDELVYKFNFVKAWTIKEILGYMRDTETKRICGPETPIRMKRKFAAELLLSPQETVRNINVLRNQLASLLSDILDDAVNAKMTLDKNVDDKTKEEDRKNEEDNKRKDDEDKPLTKQQTISYEIIHKKYIEEDDEGKQEAITNYCNDKINGDLQAMRVRESECDIETVADLAGNICKSSISDTLKENRKEFENYIRNHKIDGIKLSEMKENNQFSNEFIKFISNDNKEVEEESKDISDISQCNKEKIVDIVKDLIEKKLDNKLLTENKDLIISFFEKKNIDGKKIDLMNRKQFGDEMVKHCNNNKKIRGPILKMFKKLTNYKDQENKKLYDAAANLWELMVKHISNKLFWPKQIKTTNNNFKEKITKQDESGLLDENIENLERLSIDRFKLPVFKEFVEFFFINTDKEQYEIVEDPNGIIGKNDYLFYREFLKSWRQTPIWYTYDHDILLLELVLRNGFESNSDDILNDLKGDKMNEYKIRLQCDESNTIDDPYYEFRRWCYNHYNVLHRLKYVTNTIIKNLENKKYGGDTSLISIRIPDEIDRPKYDVSSLIFSDYQSKTLCDYAERKEIKLNRDDMKEDNVRKKKKDRGKKWCCCNGLFKRICELDSICCISFERSQVIEDIIESQVVPQITMNDEMLIPGKSISYMHNRRRSSVYRISNTMINIINEESQNTSDRIRKNDPFIKRDINTELLQTFQTFNLMEYGEPLIKCIIDQIQKHNRNADWYLLGELLNAMPYPLATVAINDEKTKAILRHTAEPEVLDKICYRLIEGSSFRPSAALGVAEFFDDLASKDMVQEEIWISYCKKYEVMGYQEISKIESDHLLFVLMTIPLLQHSGKSLFDLALEQKRVEFLNNGRIDAMHQHLYQQRFLKPEEEINMNNLSYSDMLELIFFHPFKFYFTAQGYHWIAGMLFMLYLGFIMMYVWYRPISGQKFAEDLQNNDYHLLGVEVAFWTMNIGYIAYEILECAEKGFRDYLNVGAQGQANVFDVIISILWMILLIIRILFISEKMKFNGENANNIQQAYVFLFGLQIILLTMRALALFSNSQYLGTLVKVIKLMAYEIVKFLFIFLVIMIGILFGLWLISAENYCNNDESGNCGLYYKVDNIEDALIYVFQVFIGTGDLSGVVNEGIAIIFMVIATLFGTLILTNLLIALMTTEYLNVQEKAKDEVIYNKAELTSDLSKRSRLMPPPFNILILILTLILDVINFFTSLISPYYLNIYAYIDHQLFFNLQNFNIWQCEYDEWKRSEGTTLKYKTRIDILSWYFISWWFDWIEHDDDDSCPYWRIHHKSCYGVLLYDIGHNNNGINNIIGKIRTETYKGITMTEYLERYEKKRKHKIDGKDKQLLKTLSSNTLFCQYCYRPFLGDDVNVKKELTTPYIALLDLISAIMFVLVPIAWIPLVIFFTILALKDYIFGSFQDNDHDENKYYQHLDFDKEYFPQQFWTHK